MARAERCRQRFADFPAVVLPAKSQRGGERHPWQPLATQTSQQETAILAAGAVIAAHRHNGDGQHLSRPMDTVTSTHEKAMLTTGALLQMANSFEHPGSDCRTRDLTDPLWTQPASNTTGILSPGFAVAIDNYQGNPRGTGDPLPTQAGSETLAILAARILPNRTNGTSRSAGEPMETLVGNAGSGGLGVLSSGILPFRKNTVPTTHAESMPTVTAEQIPGLVTAVGRIQCNGSIDEAKYRSHPVDQPITSQDTTTLLSSEWRQALADITLDDCHFRMLGAHEVGRGCGFDVPFGSHPGTFKVWGSARKQVDGYGNAVSPQVGYWVGLRLRAALHGSQAA